MATTINKVLREPIVLTENGRKRTITRLDAAALQLSRLATGSNVAAIRQVFSLAAMAEQRAESEQVRAAPMSRAEAKLLKSLAQRFDKTEKELK